jgi:hypothetical protein
MFSKRALIFLLIYSLYNFSNQLLLFSEESILYYNQPKTYELNLKDILKKAGDNIQGSPIIISVYNKNETHTKLKVVSKLNSMPTLDSFNHSDFVGVNGIYSISYSPCEFNYQKDIIFINIFSEKDVITSYKIDINNLDNSIYETICTNNIDSLLYPGITQTFKGVAQFGGKSGNKEVLNDLYILHENNTWCKYSTDKDKVKPNPRYGMGIISFDSGDFIIVYGGKNQKDEYENDLWVFDVENERWYLIGKSGDITNFPVNTFLPSLTLIENKGIILAFGNTDVKYNNLYAFDIYILRRILQIYKDASEKVKNELLSNLIKVYPNKGIMTLRYGLSIDQVDEEQVMFFGGYETSTNKVTDKCELLNLAKLPNLEISNCTNKNKPSERAFHSTIKYGPTILLFGGQKSPTEFYSDIYKFISSTKTWIKLDANEDSKILKMYSSKLFYNYLEGSFSDKPILINSDYNYVLRLSFVRCNNEKEMSSDKFCLPCSFGYVLQKSQCIPCIEGQYFEFEKNYFSSKCQTCPVGTHSNRRGGTGLSGCRLCAYDYFNNKTGQMYCEACPPDKTCLIGSTGPMEYQDITEEDIENPVAYLKYDNYPEFYNQEQVFKYATFKAGLSILIGFALFVSFIIFICYLCNKKSTLTFLYKLDFIPLTGGTLKKSNGGLITIIYSILISSLSVAFILRYIYWNDIIEVSSLDTSKSTNRKELKSSIVLELDIFGEYLPCIDENSKSKNTNTDGKDNSTLVEGICSPDILFGKNGNYSYFGKYRNNYFSCISINERQCRIKFIDENCETELKNLNSLNFHIKNEKTYISLYKWILKNYWDTTLYNVNSAKMPGYSIAEGIFKANDDITKMKYVFKGDKIPSVISLSLSSLYYSIESDDSFSGHRINFLNYQRNELKNEYSFTTNMGGAKLDFEFVVSPNSNIVNVKKDISLLDFFAFLLGILAGFAFLSRVTKHVLEKCNFLNYTSDNFVVLQEENIQNIELEIQKIENQK